MLWRQPVVDRQYGATRPVRESAHGRVYILISAKCPAPSVEVQNHGDRTVTLRHIQAGRNVWAPWDKKILDLRYGLGLAGQWSHAGHHGTALLNCEVRPAGEALRPNRRKQCSYARI